MNIPLRPEYRALARLVGQEQRPYPLTEVALEIARPWHPDLDAGFYLRQIGFWAFLFRREWEPEDGVEAGLAALNRLLFEEEGFRGDQDSYHSSDNSWLHRVVDRRSGIPVTLSVLYLDIGWQAGLPLQGMNFPYHFLLRARREDGMWLWIDPFDGGRFWAEDEPEWWHPYVGDLQLDLAQVPVADPAAIVNRVLSNLKALFERQAEWEQVQRVIEQRLLIDPCQPSEIRELGLIARHLGDVERCVQCFEEYLRLSPAAPDAARIRRSLERLRDLVQE